MTGKSKAVGLRKVSFNEYYNIVACKTKIMTYLWLILKLRSANT